MLLKDNKEFEQKLNDLGVMKMEKLDEEIMPFPAQLPPGAGCTNFLINELEGLNVLVVSYFTEVPAF